MARIRVPSMVSQSDADTGVVPSDARAIYEGLGDQDKRLEMVAGDHYLQQPGNAREKVADLVVAWLASRT